ncbi:MAG: c-type cytochrome [Pseudomonadota bacterium]
MKVWSVLYSRCRALLRLLLIFMSSVVAISSSQASANGANKAPGNSPSEEASIQRGQVVFRQCSSCHALDPEELRYGPHLYGVVGRSIASVEGYSYSDGLLAKDGVWTDRDLRLFLTSPNKFAPGTKKQFRLRSDADLDSLIAYLNSIGP